MTTRERFGNYLLLKKLSEDPLGEVFRAGRIGGEGVEQVLLLRILNGAAVEGSDLEASLRQRKPMQEMLRSPNIGTGIDAGAYQGVPYIAYDYVSGKDLAALMSQAVRKSQPVPPEHALLVTERLAMGLAVAHDTRFSGERIMHGFLVPELVMLSNEGEIRVLGFEASRGLRAAALGSRPLGETFARYLSPESRSGQPPSSSDDVYSLAVILLDLLSGRPQATAAQAGFRPAIEKVSSLGFPNIASLIEKSLQPAGSRIGDAVTWHKALDQLVQENNATSTPFHLAFYMHNLFRDDIERESAELESEKTIDFTSEDLQRLLNPEKVTVEVKAPAKSVATPSPTPPPKPPPPQSLGATKPPLSLEKEPLQRAPELKHGAEEGKRVSPLWIAAAVLALLGGAGAIWFFALRDSTAAASGTSVAAADVVATPVAGPAASSEPLVPLGPTPEEIQRRIDEAVSASQAETEVTLRKQNEELVRSLQQQLATAQKQAEEAAEKADEARLAAEQQAEEEEATTSTAGSRPDSRIATAEPVTAPATSSASTSNASTPNANSAAPPNQPQSTQPQSTQASTTPPGGNPASGTPAAATQTATTQEPRTASAGFVASSGESTPGSSAAATRPRETTTVAGGSSSPTAASQRPVTPTSTASPAAPAERVRQGQLVDRDTPGAVPPRVKSKPAPAYPLAAERLRREATVEVTVLVDENGQVIDAAVVGNHGFGFGDNALKAARQTTFFPATKDGVKVKMQFTLTFKFVNQQ